MTLKHKSPALEGFKEFMWYMFICILVTIALYVTFIPPELNAIVIWWGAYLGFIAAQDKEIKAMTNNFHYYCHLEKFNEQQSKEKVSCTTA